MSAGSRFSDRSRRAFHLGAAPVVMVIGGLLVSKGWFEPNILGWSALIPAFILAAATGASIPRPL